MSTMGSWANKRSNSSTCRRIFLLSANQEIMLKSREMRENGHQRVFVIGVVSSALSQHNPMHGLHFAGGNNALITGKVLPSKQKNKAKVIDDKMDLHLLISYP